MLNRNSTVLEQELLERKLRTDFKSRPPPITCENVDETVHTIKYGKSELVENKGQAKPIKQIEIEIRDQTAIRDSQRQRWQLTLPVEQHLYRPSSQNIFPDCSKKKEKNINLLLIQFNIIISYILHHLPV